MAHRDKRCGVATLGPVEPQRDPVAVNEAGCGQCDSIPERQLDSIRVRCDKLVQIEPAGVNRVGSRVGALGCDALKIDPCRRAVSDLQ